MKNDSISRQAAIAEFSCCELTPDGGIDVNYAIDFLKQMPSAQPDRELIEQLRLERDTAIQQLKDLGYGLGEKPKTDDTISRQAAIDALVTAIREDPYYDSNEAINGLGVCDVRVILNDLPSAQPDKTYEQGWKDGREALKKEVWEYGRDRLD